jgi:hypothetical protein
LYQNIPNPFSIQTEIKYYIPESATNGSLLIFNMQGTLIKSLLISAFGNGSQTICKHPVNHILEKNFIRV